MTLPQMHARNSFDATSAALIKAVESDTFKNKGEYEAVTEVKSVLQIYFRLNHLSKMRNPQSSYSDWKTWKMGRHFPVNKMSGNFEQTEKVGENHTEYWKFRQISENNVICHF